jgi:hypothetical protein
VVSSGGGGGSGSGQKHSRKVAGPTSGAERKRSDIDDVDVPTKKLDSGFRVPGGTKRKRSDDDDDDLVPNKKMGRTMKTPRVCTHLAYITENVLTNLQTRINAPIAGGDTMEVDSSPMSPSAATLFSPELLAKFKPIRTEHIPGKKL